MEDWCIRQPNGLLALFSTRHGKFERTGLTHGEALLLLLREGIDEERARALVRRASEDRFPLSHAGWGNGLSRWHDCLRLIRERHGESAVRLAEVEGGAA
jgi:hypothetical protein